RKQKIFKMKIKQSLFILLFLLVATVAFPQEQELESYIQEIAGSNLVIEMVAIPGGTYTMGSPENEENRYEDEGPAHEVKIDAFWMAQYEITWDLYNLFVNRAIDAVPASTRA